ncbi:MAG: hypothetical protein ACUZ8E_16200 [Candidatus Anammoxibacter sp.]
MLTKVKLTNEIEDVANFRNISESTVISNAIKIGVDKLWKESVIDKYLTNEISRDEAVKLVGLSLVILAEEQKIAIIEDINWGLNA